MQTTSNSSSSPIFTSRLPPCPIHQKIFSAVTPKTGPRSIHISHLCHYSWVPVNSTSCLGYQVAFQLLSPLPLLYIMSILLVPPAVIFLRLLHAFDFWNLFIQLFTPIHLCTYFMWMRLYTFLVFLMFLFLYSSPVSRLLLHQPP